MNNIFKKILIVVTVLNVAFCNAMEEVKDTKSKPTKRQLVDSINCFSTNDTDETPVDMGTHSSRTPRRIVVSRSPKFNIAPFLTALPASIQTIIFPQISFDALSTDIPYTELGKINPSSLNVYLTEIDIRQILQAFCLLFADDTQLQANLLECYSESESILSKRIKNTFSKIISQLMPLSLSFPASSTNEDLLTVCINKILTKMPSSINKAYELEELFYTLCCIADDKIQISKVFLFMLDLILYSQVTQSNKYALFATLAKAIKRTHPRSFSAHLKTTITEKLHVLLQVEQAICAPNILDTESINALLSPTIGEISLRGETSPEKIIEIMLDQVIQQSLSSIIKEAEVQNICIIFFTVLHNNPALYKELGWFRESIDSKLTAIIANLNFAFNQPLAINLATILDQNSFDEAYSTLLNQIEYITIALKADCSSHFANNCETLLKSENLDRIRILFGSNQHYTETLIQATENLAFEFKEYQERCEMYETFSGMNTKKAK